MREGSAHSNKIHNPRLPFARDGLGSLALSVHFSVSIAHLPSGISLTSPLNPTSAVFPTPTPPHLLRHNLVTSPRSLRMAALASASAVQPTTSSRKLVLLGESAVGKSSLVLQFVKQQFDDYRESTIGSFPVLACASGLGSLCSLCAC